MIEEVPKVFSSVYDILLVTGPTASGKTSLAANIAQRIGGEIISCRFTTGLQGHESWHRKGLR